MRLSTSRKPTYLPQSLNHRLNSYALAASAAGVGLLALPHPTEAKVVYTHAHVVLAPRSNSHYYLDLNHDGIKDFTFSHFYFYSTTSQFWASVVQMSPYKSNGNGVAGNNFASALRAGVKVGPRDNFSKWGFMAWARGTGRSQNSSFTGAWANGGKGLSNRYVGLQFSIKGKVHYGWARVNVSKFRFRTTLTGYAYETIPNKPIITGKTKGPDVMPIPEAGTLGHLVLGRR
jgi:hypothetical protein